MPDSRGSSSATSEVLKSLNLLLQETQSGKRPTSAISQATRQDVENDDPDTWRRLEADLISAGSDAASVASERNLIRTWIDTVWLEDHEGSERDYGPETGPGNLTANEVSLSPSKDARLRSIQPPKTRRILTPEPVLTKHQQDSEGWKPLYQSYWTNVAADMKSQHSSTYTHVQVLLLRWVDQYDDLDTAAEVNSLQAVFKDKFGFGTEIKCLDIRGPKLQVQINYMVACFLHMNDGPNTLIIVYYAGHGTVGT